MYIYTDLVPSHRCFQHSTGAGQHCMMMMHMLGHTGIPPFKERDLVSLHIVGCCCQGHDHHAAVCVCIVVCVYKCLCIHEHCSHCQHCSTEGQNLHTLNRVFLHETSKWWVRLQADIKKFQVATASGAKVLELSGPSRSRAQALVNDTEARASASEGEVSPVQCPTELREGSSSGNGGDVQVTVLHAACSTRSVALVEFIWQVRTSLGIHVLFHCDISKPEAQI